MYADLVSAVAGPAPAPPQNPLDTEAVYAFGRRMLGFGQYPDAALSFRLMLFIAPEDERAWLGLGLSHERQGQLDIARELYALGAEAVKSAKCRLACARCLVAEARPQDAIEEYERAAELAEARGEDEIAVLARREGRTLS